MITAKQIHEAFYGTSPEALTRLKAKRAAHFLENAFDAGAYLQENIPSRNLARFHTFEISLEALNHLLPGCHGVEVLRLDEFDELKDDLWRNTRVWGRIVAFYLNRGDTYDTTILYDIPRGEFVITSWGDWYEENVIMGEPTNE